MNLLASCPMAVGYITINIRILVLKAHFYEHNCFVMSANMSDSTKNFVCEYEHISKSVRTETLQYEYRESLGVQVWALQS